MGFGTKKILKDYPDWLMCKTLLPKRDSVVLWNKIFYGAGKFLSFGYRSDDLFYTNDLSGGNLNKISDEYGYGYWRSIAYGRGIFVAASSGGDYYAYSQDGISWVISTSVGGKNSIAYGKGIFVAVGNSRTASYSIDGMTWVETTIPAPPTPGSSNQNFYSVSYGNGCFVALSTTLTTFNGIKYACGAISTNGINWTSYLINTGGESWVSQSIAFGNGVFVAVPCSISTTLNSRKVFYSFDGINWGKSFLNLPNVAIYNITYGSGKFCAINATSKNLCYHSSDGGIWFQSILKRDQIAEGIGYGDGKFVVIGGTRISYTKSNSLPANFTSEIFSPYNQGEVLTGNWNCHAFGRGTHVFISSSLGKVLCSTTTLPYSWELATIQSKSWNDAKYGGGIFIAVSSDQNGISYSNDGKTWSNVTNAAVSRLSITYGAGRFVCVGNSTQASYSSNGSSWTNVTLPSSGWKNVKYGLGKFVAIKNGANFIYSSNGITWNSTTVPSGNWGKLQYGGGIFVAFSETQSSQFIYSTDGISWSLGNIPINATIISFKYGGGIFIAIPSNNKAIYSYDGINWIDGINYNYSSGDSDIRTIGYGHGFFIAPIYGTNRIISAYPEIFRQTNVSASTNL